MKNITCDELDRLLQERFLGTLNGDEALALQAHIEGCASCRARVGADDAIARTLATMPAIPCPPHVLRAIKAATVDHPTPARRSRRLPSWQMFGWKPAWAGMAAACACLALFLMSRALRHDTEPFDIDPGRVEATADVVRWSIVYAAHTLHHTQARVLHQTVAGDLPRSLHSAVSRVPILRGVIL
ncbi:zf-HC2 domain-containing protein [Candidatus Fermentibacteria bacterium]|nr:zf-HC2 domain-containing protein [Candidatus Fermentibacteria bacterium]